MNYYQKKFPNVETRFDKIMQKIKILNETRSKIMIISESCPTKIYIQLINIEKLY